MELVPPGVVTVTWCAPVPAGLVAVNDVALVNVTDVAAVNPNETVEPAVNPVPVTVTTVPPANGPAAGDSAVTDGTAS